MNLQLSLKRKWFDMTNNGEKKEDYREVTPYWCNRLLLVNGEVKSKIWWHQNFFEMRSKQKTIISLGNKDVSTKIFTTNTMTLGYPSKDNSDRIKVFKHAGIEIRTGNPDWGAEEGTVYFVIKHGEKI